VEVAHAWGSHHFRARAISIKSALSLIISDKDILIHRRVRARGASRQPPVDKFKI
jgi:hypothetical protein